MTFKFVDDLPPIKPSAFENQVYAEFAAALRGRPNVWAQWPTAIADTTARAYVSVIRNGMLKAFRGGGFEGAHREGVLYVRYIGEPNE